VFGLIVQDGTSVHAPWKLATCMEPSANGMCLINRIRPGICPCEHNSYALNTQNDPEIVTVFENDVKKTIVRCGALSQDTEVGKFASLLYLFIVFRMLTKSTSPRQRAAHLCLGFHSQ
jgi:hypothetical protein